MTVPQPLLEGRRILVTGAATGIGAAAVRVLHTAGAHVAATYHRTAPADDAPAVKWLQCDVRDADSVDAAFAEAVAGLGGMDVLVNAAGSWQSGVPGNITGDEIDFLLATNVKATILTNQAAHTVMRGNGGQIINFGSAEAVMGSPIAAVYAATKALVTSFSEALWYENKSRDVYVMGLCPGMTESEFAKRAGGTTKTPALLTQTAEQVVQIALAALRDRQNPTVVCGELNMAMTGLTRLMPRKAIVTMMGNARPS